jgi:hypothetical protein
MLKKLVMAGLITLLLLALVLGGCGPAVEPVTFFPVQKEVPNAMLQALLQGELVVENGCLRVSGNLILWPYGYSVQTEDGETLVLNAEGRAVARVGDFVQLGGGEIPAFSAEARTGTALPEGCAGPYWLTGEVVGDTALPPDVPSLNLPGMP